MENEWAPLRTEVLNICKSWIQVQQQPDGTFTTREHSLLVLPMFLEPALAYLLYEVCHHLVEWRDSGDVNRLKMLQGKLRKMVTTLKVRLMSVHLPPNMHHGPHSFEPLWLL